EFAYPYATTDTADVAFARVLSSAGSYPRNRDATDTRITNNALTNTGTVTLAPDSTEWNNIISAPTVTRPAGWDTDNDGMPNSWETSRGLNPNLADNNVTAANGYTNLENYLNDLTLIANW